MVLGILFLSLSNADINFGARLSRKLTSRIYTAIQALSITSRVELIDKREFVKLVLDKNSKTFIVYVVALKATRIADMAIHSLQKALIAAF